MSGHKTESAAAELRKEVTVDPFLMVFGLKAKKLGISETDRRRLNDIFSTMSNKNLMELRDFFKPLSTMRTLNIYWKTTDKAKDLELLETVMKSLDVNVNETKTKLNLLPKRLGFSVDELFSARKYLSEQLPEHAKTAAKLWDEERKNLEILTTQLGLHKLRNIRAIKQKDLEEVKDNSPLVNVLILTEMAKRYRLWGLYDQEKAAVKLAKTELKRSKKEISKSTMLSDLNKKALSALKAVESKRALTSEQVKNLQTFGRITKGIVEKLSNNPNKAIILESARILMSIRKGAGDSGVHLKDESKKFLTPVGALVYLTKKVEKEILSLSYSSFVSNALIRLNQIKDNQTDRQSKSKVFDEITKLLKDFNPDNAVVSADQILSETGVKDVGAVFSRYKKTKVFEQLQPLDESSPSGNPSV